jgi:uncharacterized protein (TIGR02246 family)
MEKDEREIRALIETWMAATKAGDVETVLGLMTDDVVFLVPGRPPMGRSEFAAAAKTQAKGAAPRIDGASEIREIKVLGDWAYLWTRLSVTVTPSGGAPTKRAGHTLSVLKKVNGKWLLARDANMLAPEA